MDALKAGLAIWRRTWKRSVVIGLLAHLLMLLLAALFVLVLADPDADLEDNTRLGILFWVMWMVPLGDQLLALSVYRAEQAHRAGVPPRAWHRPRSLGWCVLTASFVTVLLAGTSLVLPLLGLLTPVVYVSALAAGVERRALPSAMVRGFRLSKGFRSAVFWTALALWSVRWVVSVAMTQLTAPDDVTLNVAGTIAMTLFNLLVSGLFAAVMVAFYQRMVERHDDVTGGLARVFE